MSTAESRELLTQLEVPSYSLEDVVRYLGIPVWAAFTLLGRDFPPLVERKFYPFKGILPVDLKAEKKLLVLLEDYFPPLLFQDFAYLFIKSSFLELWKRLGKDPIHIFHYSLTQEGHCPGQPEFEKEKVLIFSPDYPNWIINHIPELTRIQFSHDEIHLAKNLVLQFAERVEVENGLALRLFPFSRKPGVENPRTILIDPRKRFGNPTINGTGVPSQIIWERFQAGDGVCCLAEDYEINIEQVEEAIRFESRGVDYWPDDSVCN